MMYYVEEPDGTVRKAESEEEGMAAFNNRWQHKSELEMGGEKIRVSTVFLGLDHNFFGEGPPLLYETMVFGGDLHQYCDRTSTREEAMKAHEEALEKVLNSRSLPPT